MIGPRAKGNRCHSAARRRSISRAPALIRGISDAALFDHSLGWSASARRPAAVILTHAISTVCLATITRRVYAVARPARTSSTICGTVKPCAIMMASVHPSREAASSSSARRRSGGLGSLPRFSLLSEHLVARNIKLSVLQNREPELPADCRHVGFFEDQLAQMLPVPTLLALLADRGHVFPRFPNCAQRAAIFRGNGRDELFGEIRRGQHGRVN